MIDLGDVTNDFDGVDDDKDRLTARINACVLDVQSVDSGFDMTFKLTVSYNRSDGERVVVPHEPIVNLTIVEPSLALDRDAAPR